MRWSSFPTSRKSWISCMSKDFSRCNHYLIQRKVLRNIDFSTFLRTFHHRSDKVRTCGLHVPNVARYQLRYTPICIQHLSHNRRKSYCIRVGPENQEEFLFSFAFSFALQANFSDDASPDGSSGLHFEDQSPLCFWCME